MSTNFMPKCKDVFTLDDLANLLGVDSLSDWADRFDSHYWPDNDPNLSEEENWEWQDRERDEAATRYVRAIEAVACELAEHHKLTFVERKTKKRGTFYVLRPTTSWEDALSEVRETINGYGIFHFNTNRYLKQSGPFLSAKQAVLAHLGWISSYPAVYADDSVQIRMDRHLR